MTTRLAFFLLCALSATLSSARADDPPALPKYATQMRRFSYPNCGDADRPIRFTPQGNIAVGCDDGFVQIIDPTSGALLWQSPPDSPKLWAITFPDANTLMAITSDHRVVLYNLTTYTELNRYKLPTPDPIYSYFQSQSGRVLFYSGTDPDADAPQTWSLNVINAADGVLIARRPLNDKPNAIALSADGQHVAWVISDGDYATNDPIRWTQTEKLADSEHKKFTCKPKSASYFDPILQFSPDASTLVAAFSVEGDLAYCFHATDEATPTRAFLLESNADDSRPRILRFSSDNKYVQFLYNTYEVQRDSHIPFGTSSRWIEIASGDILDEPPPDNTPLQTSFITTHHKDFGPLVIEPATRDTGASNGFPAHIIGMRSPNKIYFIFPFAHLDNEVYKESQLFFSADGRWLVARDELKLLSWDATQTTNLFPSRHIPTDLGAFIPSADGQHLLTQAGQSIMRWAFASQSLSKIETQIETSISAIYPTENSNILLLCEDLSAPPSIRLTRFNLTTHQSAPDTSPPSLSHCPDPNLSNVSAKRWLISTQDADNNPAGDFLITPDKKIPLTLPPEHSIRNGQLSPDAQLVAYPFNDTVALFDLNAQKMLQTITLTAEPKFWIFSPDSQWLVVATEAEGDPIQLLHIPTKKMTSLKPKKDTYTKALSFSFDNKTLSSLHSRDRIFTWDLAAVLAKP